MNISRIALAVCALLGAAQAHAVPAAPSSSPTMSASPSSLPWTYQQKNQSLSIRWGAVSGATYYQVFVDDEQNYVGSSLSYPDIFTSTGYHYLKYRACDSSGCSSFSPEQRIYVYGSPSSPPGLNVSNSYPSAGDWVNISWNWAPGIINQGAHYQIKVIGPGGSSTIRTTPQNPGQGTTSISTYSYDYGTTRIEVRGCNPNNMCGAPSTTSFVISPPVPVALADTAAEANTILSGDSTIITWRDTSAVNDPGAYFNIEEVNENGSRYASSFNKVNGIKLYGKPVSPVHNGWTTYNVSACNSVNQCGPATKTSIFVPRDDANNHRGVYLGMYYGDGINVGGSCTESYWRDCDSTTRDVHIDAGISSLSCSHPNDLTGLDLDCLIQDIIDTKANVYYYAYSYFSQSHKNKFGEFLTKLKHHAPDVKVYANYSSTDATPVATRAAELAVLKASHSNLAGLSIDDFDLHLDEFTVSTMTSVKQTLNNAGMKVLVTAYYRDLLLRNESKMKQYRNTFDAINLPVLIQDDGSFSLSNDSLDTYVSQMENIREIMSKCDCSQVPVYTMIYATPYGYNLSSTTQYVRDLTKLGTQWSEGVTMYRLPTMYQAETHPFKTEEDIHAKMTTIIDVYTKMKAGQL